MVAGIKSAGAVQIKYILIMIFATIPMLIFFSANHWPTISYFIFSLGTIIFIWAIGLLLFLLLARELWTECEGAGELTELTSL